ncbi:MAG: conserved hypothetical integral membrane protein [uncultured archaeon A07HB70]|nr:MAG: conserved hypothetical integral membrane protein [uncultured archaeon A07HB70]
MSEDVGRVTLAALFVTALVVAQLTAAKLVALPLPRPLPVVGGALVVPGAAFAYAVTFFASDCYAELYGKTAAQVVVNVGFAMNLVLLGLVWATILAPVASASAVGAAEFRTVLGAGTNVVAGSLLAYALSQNWDVLVFHRLRTLTGGDHLWLRNLASTGTSQAVDTVVFVGVAFGAAPALLGVGAALPPAVLVQLAVGQYLLKLGIAVLDTPLVYGAVRLLRDYGTAKYAPV